MAAPLTNRLGHFITTKMSRHILLQAKSTVSISDIMNEGKILLVNLSKGDIGEDQSFFFGTLLTSLVWMAAYQRTKIPESKRRDFFLYGDEFQNFATPQFTDITSEGRKFHISLTASHQNIAQIEDPSVLKTVAANVGSIICLKASPDDEAFILPFMEPA
jgi:type IV secretory pathway TraG/TraD family ATPase VirD4